VKEIVLTIRLKLGLHARPASMFVQEASRFKSEIKVSKDGQEINGKSVMGLMLLEAANGTKIKVTARGPDEAEAIAAIAGLFERGFDEEEDPPRRSK
jgi:phosphocarrier protein